MMDGIRLTYFESMLLTLTIRLRSIKKEDGYQGG